MCCSLSDLLPIHPSSVLFCLAASLFELFIAGLGGLGYPLPLLSHLGSRPCQEYHFPELVDSRFSVHTLCPVFLRRNGQYAFFRSLVRLLLLQSALNFRGHPRLSGVEIEAQLDLGAQFVDILSSGSRRPNETDLQAVFRDAEVLGDRPCGDRLGFVVVIVVALPRGLF